MRVRRKFRTTTTGCYWTCRAFAGIFDWAYGQRPPMPSCPSLENASAAKQLSYLETGRSLQSTSCTEFAIRRLGEERYAPAADVLLSLLDFESPSAL